LSCIHPWYLIFNISSDIFNSLVMFNTSREDSLSSKKSFCTLSEENRFTYGLFPFLYDEACRNKDKWTKRTGRATELLYLAIDLSREASGVSRLHLACFLLCGRTELLYCIGLFQSIWSSRSSHKSEIVTSDVKFMLIDCSHYLCMFYTIHHHQ